MKKLWLPGFLFAAWMALLSTDIPAGAGFLPAPGAFFHPFQGIWQSVVPVLPPAQLDAGTHREVRILFDERHVPHIYAASLDDAVYAQGWLHAANRLFQMDLTTRATAGRLSEWLGPRTLQFDRQRREMGMEWLAEQKAKAWEQDRAHYSMLEAYTEGVNAYIRQLDYRHWPVEYKILHQTPTDWTPAKTALAGLSMSLSLCLKEHDVDYTRARDRLSAADFAFLFPEANPLEDPVIPAHTGWDFDPLSIPPAPATGSGDPGGTTPPPGDPAINGSNNWAVAPTRTASGHALLANDPHLQLTLPSIWYEVEIHTPDMHVHGVSIPGIPLIIIGFNPDIAWGSTNSGQDVLDWYAITWQDSTRKRYLLDGVYTDARLRPETIGIRGLATVTDTVRYTRFGPVSTQGDHRDMAMKWIPWARAQENELAFLALIDRARDVDGYREAISHFPYPAQNKVFASVTGDIALSVTGIIPLRDIRDGQYVRAGDSTARDWEIFIPFAQNPYVINPARGYVSSANQAPAGPDYPYPLIGQRTFEDYRGRMVNRLLDSMMQTTVPDMMALQQNNTDLHAAELLPELLHLLDSADCADIRDNALLRQLRQWNFDRHRDSVSPVAFDIWHERLTTLVYDELDSLGVMRPEAWRTIEILRDHPGHAVFDWKATPQITEDAGAIICMAYREMRDSLRKLSEDGPITWGTYKASAIPHLARLPGFGVEFVSASGGPRVINAMSKTHGPSWRMIVEMRDPPVAWVNYPGGQSGHPVSPHYADFVPSFFEGEYYEVRLRPDPSAWTPVSETKLRPR